MNNLNAASLDQDSLGNGEASYVLSSKGSGSRFATSRRRLGGVSVTSTGRTLALRTKNMELGSLANAGEAVLVSQCQS